MSSVSLVTNTTGRGWASATTARSASAEQFACRPALLLPDRHHGHVAEDAVHWRVPRPATQDLD